MITISAIHFTTVPVEFFLKNPLQIVSSLFDADNYFEFSKNALE